METPGRDGSRQVGVTRGHRRGSRFLCHGGEELNPSVVSCLQTGYQHRVFTSGVGIVGDGMVRIVAEQRQCSSIYNHSTAPWYNLPV